LWHDEHSRWKHFLAAQRIEEAERQIGESLLQARDRRFRIGRRFVGATPDAIGEGVDARVAKAAELARVERGEVLAIEFLRLDGFEQHEGERGPAGQGVERGGPDRAKPSASKCLISPRAAAGSSVPRATESRRRGMAVRRAAGCRAESPACRRRA
jgi:hypothetical protein